MRVFRIPTIVQSYFHRYVWRIKIDTPIIYLTFDDGPNPIASSYVLSILKKHNIKATFFCVGDNIRKFPETLNEIKMGNHAFGNHTQNHLKGWSTDTKAYTENIEECTKSFQQVGINTSIFRPPYGRIKKKQGQHILSQGYKIIMWDILSYDYDKTISIQNSLSHIIRKSRNGSIVVFHDSEKALPQLKQILEPYIVAMKQKGYTFSTIQ